MSEFIINGQYVFFVFGVIALIVAIILYLQLFINDMKVKNTTKKINKMEIFNGVDEE